MADTGGQGVHWNYCNAGEQYADGTNLYFTAFLDMPDSEGGTTRTVICRLIIPLDVARKMREQTGTVINKGGH